MYLAEIDAWDPALAAVRILRYSQEAGFNTSSDDTPPDAYFEPRIAQPIKVRRHMFSYGATMGRSVLEYGELVLLNGDGELDFILGLGLDGRALTIYHTSVSYRPSFPADFLVLLTGTMEQPEFSGDAVTIRLRDRQADLSVRLQTTRYAGDNVLPAGLEGVAGDLKGKPKPLCFGVVKNVLPPCVNTTRQIYQVHDGAVASVDAVYDRGAAYTAGAAYADQADMEANAPAAGQYRVWAAGGYFRLGSTPDGEITADVTEGETAADRTAGQIYARVIERLASNSSAALLLSWARLVTAGGSTADALVTDSGLAIVERGSLTGSDPETLDAAEPSEVGLWVNEETTVAEACDRIAETPGAWWGVDRFGSLHIQQLVAPSVPQPAARLTEHDLLRPLERLATNDPGKGLPVYRQVLRWGRHYQVQSSDLAASVTLARRSELSKEWREVVATDSSVVDAHPLSPEVIRDSLYSTAAGAQAEVNRRLALYSPRRDRFEIVVPLTPETLVLDLGDVVELTHPRYGLEAGEQFVVLGAEPDAKNGRITLNLWGSTAL